MRKLGVNSKKKKKKKKRLTSAWLQDFSTFGLVIGTKRASTRRRPFFFFFFFFGDHLNYCVWFNFSTYASTIKPVTASHRPAFDKKNVGGAINLVS